MNKIITFYINLSIFISGPYWNRTSDPLINSQVQTTNCAKGPKNTYVFTTIY